VFTPPTPTPPPSQRPVEDGGGFLDAVRLFLQRKGVNVFFFARGWRGCIGWPLLLLVLTVISCLFLSRESALFARLKGRSGRLPSPPSPQALPASLLDKRERSPFDKGQLPFLKLSPCLPFPEGSFLSFSCRTNEAFFVKIY